VKTLLKNAHTFGIISTSYFGLLIAADEAAKINAECPQYADGTGEWWVYMNDKQILGAYIKEKRNSRGITVRAFAEMINMGCGLYSDLESGRRCPADLETLDMIKISLRLSEEESQKLYDLAGKAREAAPPDLTGYINNTPKARIALRVAKDTATDEDWDYITNYLKRKDKET